MSSLQRSIGGTPVAAIPLQCFFLLCFFHGPTPPGRTCTLGTYLEMGSPFILLIFLVHIELMVLVREQNSASLLKEAIIEFDIYEQGEISF